eukprot:GFUD01005630.1.p1 GENE.GFUD01005630.1~~GFUD01005630.1.p1  ORF type:complete len:289 (+),score=49.03 GFUD01005630.1:65-931(+)
MSYRWLIISVFIYCRVQAEPSECSASQMQEIIRMGTLEGCRPRPLIVQVPYDSDNFQLMAPTHVEVNRCQGSCGHFHHSCVPAEIRKKEVSLVLTERTVQEGVSTSLCDAVEVEEHLSCQCGCPITEHNCGANQVFLPYECRCSCTNLRERDSCLEKGWHWDRDTCQCMCPGRPYPSCPSSFMFDYSITCSCVEMQNIAFTELELVVLIMSLGLIGGVASFLQCYKRKTGLFKQDRRVKSISRELEEILPKLSEESEKPMKSKMLKLSTQSIAHQMEESGKSLLKDQG